jgi:hypothetical protein
MISSRFNICERYSRGKPIWDWIRRISVMKKKKIKWIRQLDDPTAEIFIITIDGTDFRLWERKHPKVNQDKKQCSKKFNHGAAKYEIGISIFTAQVVWISGPFRGAEHDMTMLTKGGLLDKVADGKMCVADRGYKSNKPEIKAKLSLPNEHDPTKINNFKSWARLRHETLNGRLKFFNILSDTFWHGFDNHKFMFEAVVVIVQYQMDNGSPIFAT